jgi:hypothetical protein
MASVYSSVYLSSFCTVATIVVIRMDASFLQHDVDRVMKQHLMQCQVRTSLSYTILELSVVKVTQLRGKNGQFLGIIGHQTRNWEMNGIFLQNETPNWGLSNQFFDQFW